MVKQFLSYLPANVWQMPPRRDTGDELHRRDDSLLSAIPREKRRVYDAYKTLNAVLDKDSFFEITPFYGRSRVVGLGRVDGYPVGVMINNPKRLGGSMDVAAGTKGDPNRSQAPSAVVAVQDRGGVQHRGHHRPARPRARWLANSWHMAQPMLKSQLGPSLTPYMP